VETPRQWRLRIESGKEELSDHHRALFKQAEEAAHEVEQKYGRDNLEFDDFEWGLISGRLSALSWVLGSEWNGSLDT
jgi:hypothetical protein